MRSCLATIVAAFLVAFPSSLPAQSEADERAVVYETYKEADEAMGRVYKVVLNRLEDDHRTAFIKAQRAWIAWRDAEAESDAFDFKISNDYGRMLAWSKRGLTIDRLATLMKTEASTRPAKKSGE